MVHKHLIQAPFILAANLWLQVAHGVHTEMLNLLLLKHLNRGPGLLHRQAVLVRIIICSHI